MVRCAHLPHFPHRCLKSHFMSGRVGDIITRPCAWWHRQHMDLMGCSNLSLALFDDAIISLFLPFEEGMCGYWFSMSVERNEIHPTVNSDSAGRDVLIVHPFFMFLTCSLTSFDWCQRLWDPSIPNWPWYEIILGLPKKPISYSIYYLECRRA